MRDYLGEKQASEFLCRKLRKTYQDMGLKNVKVWGKNKHEKKYLQIYPKV